MPLKAIASLLLSLAFLPAHPCTTFFINHDGEMLFGRNYDWLADAGMLCTNQKGLYKTSLETNDGTAITWTSRYGSISFNQYGKEFPTGGMNEKGLVVELMWLDETIYPRPDKRPAIGVLQWIQYQLDNCATINEVVATDTALRIISRGTPLHYLVADANGNAATIEFLNGKLTVHKGADLPFAALTNSPYGSSVSARRNGSVAGNNSLERFDRACEMIAGIKTRPGNKPATEYAFDILKNVSQGDFTKWSIVYDIGRKQIHFKTQSHPDVKTVNFSEMNFDCRAPAKAINMNQLLKGDISSRFSVHTAALNREIVSKALKQSEQRIQVTEAQKEAQLRYPATVRCEN